MDARTSAGESRLPGLNRLSRLPQGPHKPIRSIGSSTDETASVRSIPGPSGLPARHSRSNTMQQARPGSAMQNRADPMSPISPPTSNRHSMLVRPGFQSALMRDQQEEEIRNDLLTSPKSTSSSEDASTANTGPSKGGLRRPRPSLSDRTMETLSSIPPSPSKAANRRSIIYSGAESPVRPQSRASSSLGYSRPDSRAGSSIPGSSLPGVASLNRPASPSKISAPYGMKAPGAANKRQSVSGMPHPKTNGVGGGLGSRMKPPGAAGAAKAPGSAARPPTSKIGTARPGARNSMIGAPGGLKSPIKSPIKARETFGGPLPKPGTTPRAMPTPAGSGIKPLQVRKGPTLRGLNPPVRKLSAPTPDEGPSPPTTPDSDRKVSVSSQSLRESIAKAKAAHRATSGTPEGMKPRSMEGDFFGLGPDTDPNQLDVQDSAHVNIIRKRVNNARGDGKLNIAALCLTEIPKEVLLMHEYDPSDKSGQAWYESVDVMKLLAADNEFKELPKSIFPSDGSDSPPPDDKQPIFQHVEVIDLHGNQLTSIPRNISLLEKLTVLNLSRNQLNNDVFTAISGIQSLLELRLSENQIKGTLPDEIGQLPSLELLDLRRNQVEDIPTSIGKLSNLKTLIVSENRLSSLPFEAIFDLPKLTEIQAARNKLNGSLLPSSVPGIPTLRLLDVSTNALTAISENTEVDLPALESINLSNNRVSELPDITKCTNLTTLNAEENKISALPTGFTKLGLKHVDIGNNSLLVVDDAVGFMDSLISFKIHNNPIRERRLMKMGTEELKAELRSREAPSPVPASPSSRSRGGSGSGSTAWRVANGTVDRSHTKLKDIEAADIEPVVGGGATALVLHHNTLQRIPPAIELIGTTLTSLDLSNNKLGKSADAGASWLPDTLSLPALQTLNLASNGLASLDQLAERLSAPRLETLIVPFNRLTALPRLCTAFPQLGKLIAANNKLAVLDVACVRGLKVLDVSSNEIEQLPPALGILQGQLRTLMVNANKFRVPGWGVLEKGTEEILSWCKKRIPAGEEGSMVEYA